jgi:hypothetical protein
MAKVTINMNILWKKCRITKCYRYNATISAASIGIVQRLDGIHIKNCPLTHTPFIRKEHKKGCRTVNPAAAFHFGVSDKII